MTRRAPRTFTDAPAVRKQVPLIIGVTGCSGSGKTYSSLRLGTGIQRVFGGEIFGIDTESDRMLHYSDYFQFRHVPFPAPHSPLDYLDSINHCVKQGARIIIIDSMTHEHDGEDGVLEQIENYLEQRAGDDWKKREKLLFAAQVEPKRQRKKLNRRIVALGNIVFILCYQAAEKIKPKKGDEPENLGWQPITTSKLPYDMTARFLLTPGCEGVPELMPQLGAEKLLTKNPRQFKDWFKTGEPLSEEMGQRMAQWAAGDSNSKSNYDIESAIKSYDSVTNSAEFDALQKARGDAWKSIPPSDAKRRLQAAAEAAGKRLTEQLGDVESQL